jgi:hypothetical protein
LEIKRVVARVEVTESDQFGNRKLIAIHGPWNFLGELALLPGDRALADAIVQHFKNGRRSRQRRWAHPFPMKPAIGILCRASSAEWANRNERFNSDAFHTLRRR